MGLQEISNNLRKMLRFKQINYTQKTSRNPSPNNDDDNNINTYHVLSAYYVPGIDEETEVQRS